MAEDINAAEAGDQLAKDEEAATAAQAAADAAKLVEDTAASDAAAKAAEDVAKDASDDDKGKPEFDETVWGTTGDELGDSILHQLSDSGLSVDDAKALLFDPVKAGDPSKIDKDALIEKVGKHAANLIMAGVENLTTRLKTDSDLAVAAVHTAAGGKEAWDTMLPWINDAKNVPADKMAEFTAMIDKGGLQADLAVGHLKTLFNKDPSTTSLGKVELDGDTSPAPTKVAGLSQRDYGRELNKLARTGKETPEARATLLKARRAGKAAGI